MEALFLKLLEMSLAGGVFISVLLLIRPLTIKIPAFIRCLFWAMVGIRLVLPFEIKAPFSLIPAIFQMEGKVPSSNGASPAGQEYFSNISRMPVNFAPGPVEENVWSGITLLNGVTVIWLLGVITLTLYFVACNIRIKKQIGQSLKTESGLYKIDEISTPFISGIIKPKIIIPSGLDDATEHYAMIHEQIHIKRKDHIWKTCAFFILAIHWFNPLAWIAFKLFEYDIEEACDQKVIKTMSRSEITEYSAALLNCAGGKRGIFAAPAFGGSTLKRRIENILTYRKPTIPVIIISLVLAVLLAMLFMTNPLESGTLSTEFNTAPSDSFQQTTDAPYTISDKGVYIQTQENRDSLGNLVNTSKCIYNEDGVMTKMMVYDAEGELISNRNYLIDKSGFANEIKEYDAAGNLISTSRYSRDSDGRELSCKAEYADGSFCWWNEYSYDDKGNAVRYSRYNEDGSLIYTWQSRFDKNGHEKIRICRNSSGDELWTQVFTYSSDGTLLKAEEFAPDGDLTSTETFSTLSKKL